MAAQELGSQVGVLPACQALGVSRATFYRRQRPVPGHQQPRPTPARALCETEREQVLDVLVSPRFVDRSPGEVVATLAGYSPVAIRELKCALNASVERDFWRSSQGRMRWSWSAGLGLNRLQFDNFRGQTTGGDPFDIKIDADSEIVLLGGADFTWSFATRWHLLSGLIVERHFADWTVMDRVSGNTGSVGDYSVLGARIGAGFSF